MPNAPLVSVVIPTYNRAQLIPEAIQSVLNQTFKNFEIIVVDDGSTDNTRDVIDPFRDKIRYVVTDNRGPAHARNTGMKMAKGKYIAFLDSDDLYLPYKLDLQVSFMEAHPEIGMVCTEFSAVKGNTLIEKYHLRTFHCIFARMGWSYEDIFPVKGDFLCRAVGESVPYYIGDLFKYALMGPVLVSTTALYKREVLKKVGYQNENYHLAEEYEHTVRICKNFSVGFINYPTYLYRYHEDQISKVNQKWTKEKALTEIGIEKVMLQTVLDLGCGDKKYYAQNREWLNNRIAELYHCLGEKWLEYGDSQEARNCFRSGLSFDPSWRKNQQYLYLSFFPSIMRRIIFGLSRRLRKWSS